MAAKVDPSAIEPHHAQSAVSTSISSVVSVPKVSMFGAKAKSGFVIPKNKLSGSLVPKFRGAGKAENSNTIKEENSRQVHRKTKWGPDLTLDTAVRKGRALAYQTRLEQITGLLKFGSLDTANNEGLQTPEKTLNNDSGSRSVNDEALDLEVLELERRELIGELLQLNPSYKPPSDYKPLLKEAKVPIPTVEHAGNKFIALLLGPASNTQKRLEEETGAKVKLLGIKKDTREKCEVALPNVSEAESAYEELYISVLADTFEKVDAAVQLIELLLTPVSSNNAAVASTVSTSGSGDHKIPIESNQKGITACSMTTAFSMGDVNQAALRPMASNAPSGQQQYPTYAAPWYSSVYAQPSTGFIPSSVPHNTLPFPASPVGPFHAPSYSGQPPQFGSIQGSSTPTAFRPMMPVQSLQQPPTQASPPQGQSHQQAPVLYPSFVPQAGSTVPIFTASQPLPTGSMPAPRPTIPLSPQVVSGPLPNRPSPTASPFGGSGWSSIPQRPAFPPPSAQPVRPNSVISTLIPSVSLLSMQPSVVRGSPPAVNPLPVQSNIPPNMPSRPLAANFIPLPASPSRPTASAFPSIPPQPGSFSSPAVLLSSGAPTLAASPVSTPRPLPVPSQAPRTLSMPAAPAPMAGAPVGPQNATLPGALNSILNQASASPHPLNPVHGRPPALVPSLASVQVPRPDQAQVVLQERPPNPGSIPGTVPKPLRPISGDFTFQPLRAQVPAAVAHNQSANQTAVPLAVPQPPSFRAAMQNPASSVNSQGFARPLVTNLSQALIPPPPAAFSVSPVNRPSSNFPAFSVTNSARPRTPTGQIGPSGFPSASVRPVNIIPSIQNQGPRENQIYDPFSPTSISSAPPKKAEGDAEYEDLMASVGVK